MHAVRAGCSPIVVVFYHRVADEHPSPWSISHGASRGRLRGCDGTSPWCRSRRLRHGSQVASTSGRWSALRSTTAMPTIVRFALPLLVRQRVPFTYFVSVRHVQYGEPFTHDVVADQLHRTNTVEELRALADAGVRDRFAHAHPRRFGAGPRPRRNSMTKW